MSAGLLASIAERGLTHDQAAILALRDRAMARVQLAESGDQADDELRQAAGRSFTSLAKVTGIGRQRFSHARLMMAHAPDLEAKVMSGELLLRHAAFIAWLRRDHPDLASLAEAMPYGPQDRRASRWRMARLSYIARRRDHAARQLAGTQTGV